MKDLFKLLMNVNEPDLSNYSRVITEMETETHKTIVETWISEDGKSKFTKKQEILKKTFMDRDFLQSKLEESLEKEDYELAAKWRDELNKLNSGN